MQFARYYAHGEVAYGVVEDGMVKQITTTPFEDYEVTDHIHSLDQVQLLAPVQPGKVIAIALNYSTHLGERTRPQARGRLLQAAQLHHRRRRGHRASPRAPAASTKRASSSPSSAKPAAKSLRRTRSTT